MLRRKEFRLLLSLIKEEIERDGTALANQVSDSQLSVIMYLIALCSMSYAVWTMVQMRRIRRGEEVDESDQTAEVIQTMDGKTVPQIVPDVQNLAQTSPVAPVAPVAAAAPSVASPGPPLPPTGLPEGWTMEQWAHYGHQWVQNQK